MQSFRPPFWLRNPHLQSILASSPLRKRQLKQQSQHWINRSRSLLLSGGKGAHLLGYWTPGENQQAPLAILLHGWEGTTDSGYLLSCANRLVNEGYQVLRVALRDHDQSHHLNRELFHSCRLDEVVNAISNGIKRINAERNHLIGFSLGGNFAIRISEQLSSGMRSHDDNSFQGNSLQGNSLDNQSLDNQSLDEQTLDDKHPQNNLLDSTIAICPLMIAADTMKKLQLGPAIYHHYFSKKWRRSIRKKMNLYPQDYTQLDLQRVKSLQDLTDYFVRHHTDFASTEHYFDGYSIYADRLNQLSIPVEILMSLDDPIINPSFLKPLESLPSVRVTYTQHGGHCGFIKNRQHQSWADDFVVEKLKATAHSE